MLLEPLVTSCPIRGADALVWRGTDDGMISYDTYLNTFPAAIWKRYTRVRDLYLDINLKNGGIINIEADGHVIKSQNCPAGESRIHFDPGESKAIYFTTSADAGLISGGYGGECDDVHDVRIAINICTYRRESYVRKNAELIRSAIIDNPLSPLCGRMDMIITDNGGTLGDVPGAVVIKNRNTGGAGGFAEGLRYILNSNRATHCVFMDDDVSVYPGAFERLYAFLCCVKDEYALSPIGGAMLRLDSPTIQHEALARWHGLLSEPLKSGLDLSRIDAIYENMRAESADYSAWWFSCVPVVSAREKGLPLPIFVRMDDVEYGLRLGKTPIAVPGICVWHEPFERKHAAWIEYYHARNSLITNALRRPDINDARLLLKLLAGDILRMRYLHAEMAIKGIADYLKGPEHLMNTDPEAVHMSLAKLETVDVPLTDGIRAALIKTEKEKDSPLSRALSVITLNGLFIPGRRTEYVQAHMNAVRSHFAKSAVVNVIGDTGKGFIARRDVKKAFTVSIRAIGMLIKLKRHGAKIGAQYRAAEDRLTSMGDFGERK